MRNFGYVIASKQVTLEGLGVGWMYKEQPTDEQDSGWRVFSGYECEGYNDTPSNFGICDSATIISIDPQVEEFLLLGIGAEIERGPNGILGVISRLER